MVIFDIYRLFLYFYTLICVYINRYLIFKNKKLIDSDHDLYFSFPSISIKKDKNNTIIEGLPSIILPGYNLYIIHRNTGNKYNFDYKSGVINWNDFFDILNKEKIIDLHLD